MNLFSYRASNQFADQGLMVKGGLDKPSMVIDWLDGLPSAITVTTVAVAALSSTGAVITAACINSLSTSGTQTTINLATCGSGGTSAAQNGDRMRIRSTATLSNNGALVFDAFVYIADPSYSPS